MKLFTRMDEGTREDWNEVARRNRVRQMDLPMRVTNTLLTLDYIHTFGVSQLHHCLMTATLAYRAAADDDLVLAALMHDFGKAFSVHNHGPIAAELIRPYVSEVAYKIIYTHEAFVDRFESMATGDDADGRDEYKHESWFDKAQQFSDEWDQVSFDPSFKVMPLMFFEPLIQDVFSRPGKNCWRKHHANENIGAEINR